MTPHNITNLRKTLIFTNLILHNIVEYQAFGSRPLRNKRQAFRLSFVVYIQIYNLIGNIRYKKRIRLTL